MAMDDYIFYFFSSLYSIISNVSFNNPHSFLFTFMNNSNLMTL